MADQTEVIAASDRSVFQGVLSEQDQALVHNLLNTNQSAADLIPESIEPATLWRYLAATCKAMGRVNAAVAKLKPMIGRMLSLIQKYPDLYKSQGYKTYDDFMSHGVEQLFEISRPEAYALKGIAETYSTLSPATYAEIGISRLKTATAAIRRITAPGMPPEMIEAKKAEWLEIAKTSTVDQMETMIIERQIAGPGEREFAAIVIKTSKEISDHWNEFVKDPLIQGYVGEESPGKILDCMVSECLGDWKAQMEQEIQKRGVYNET